MQRMTCQGLFARVAAVFAVSLSLAASGAEADAALEFAGIFQDHMVLQQGRSQTVWGKATPGSSVTVKLAKGSATIATSAAATAGSDGVWQATLAVPAATKGDYSAHALSVTSGSTTVTVSDVLLGEVWLASGQSNMQFPLHNVYSKGFDPSTIPATIRYRLLGLNGGKTVSTPPYEVAMEKDSAGNPCPWMAAPDAYNMKGSQEGYWYPTFSAVGYFFAKALQERLDLPVGIVAGVQGGTQLEPFCPGNATLWNYTFGPILKFAARGLVFYQGEHGSKGSYRTVMKGLVDGYRQRWGNDFAVYYVQVAGGDRFEGVFDWEPMSSRYGYAPNREEQRLALGLMGAYANVGMTTAFDYGSPYWNVDGNKLNEGATDGNIHPSAKKPIGERLARLALAKTYGCDLQASGPLFASATATGGGKVEIAFASGTTGAGFATCRHDYDTNEDVYETKDRPIFGFALAGEDGVWRWAGAKPKAGDATKLVVASIEVPKPKYVRYAYANNPADAANLYCRTADGKFLPAIPFGSQEISGWSAAGAMSGTASAGDCTIAFPLAKYYPAGSSREARPFVWGPNGELLGEGKSYELSYANNQSAGTATVTVTGRGALSGTKSANFTLTAIEMKSCPATVNLNSIGNWPYDGTPKSPGVEFMLPTEISGKMTNRDFYQQRGRSRIMLLEGRDYTVTSVTAPNANAQTFTFTGINGVSGSVTGNATLKIPMGACRADPIPAQAHTGSAVTPKVTLVDPFGKTLVEGTDYTLGYVNNVNAGDCLSSASSPFVKVTAKSSLYAGDLYVPFEIKSGDGLSYTVTFTSFGRTVKSETVARNAAATAPPVSESGWTFDGWDSDFSRVTANLEVKARWTRALTPASFARKATIRFAGAPSGTVTNFAALVRLSSATIPGFSSADGSDIRFADAQGRLIPHEIDTWRANGESLVWVRVPTLAGPETSVTVYWGGSGASHPRAEATDTWRGYAGVWHLNEAGTGSGVALGESTRALATDGGRTGTACDGVIGGARGNPASTSTFDTSPTFLGRTKAADTPALAGRLGEHFTVSTWVRPNLVSDNLPATLFANSCATELHNNYPDRGFGVKTSGNTNYQQASYDTWEVYFHPKSGVSYLNMGALQKRDVWVKLDLVFDGAELRLYADGRFYRRTKSNGFVFPAFNLSKPFAIGGYATGSRLAFNGVYHGDFDEFRLLGEAASAARLEADYATAHDNASFTAYGAATDAQGGDEPPPVHVHDYVWTTKTSATCQAAEVQTGTCGCGDVQTRTVGEPVGHVYADGKCKWCGRQESAPVTSGGKWYRLTVDAVRDPAKKQLQLSEFYLYDAQGNRLNRNLTVTDATAASELAGGESFLTGINTWAASEGLAKLFDDNTGTKLGGSITDSANVRVILRLSEGAADVAAYNFATGNDDTSASHRQMTAWTLESSEDGQTWTELDKVTSFVPPTTNKAKYSATDFKVGGEPTPAGCEHVFGAGTGVDYGNWITGTDYTCSKCGKVRHTLETNCTYTDKILHKLNADGTTSDVSETTEKPKTTPYLIWYKPEASKDNHKAFVYFPGGGYNNVDVLNGGDQYGRTFAAMGYTVVVCWYRGYNPKDDSPFKDANAAMLAVRAYAKTLGITEVGVAGDSAGGHLASYQHVHGTGNAKSDFAILAFPCITCGESTSYGFSGNIGATTDDAKRGYCNDLFVTAATGRAFVYVATSDAIVPCVNSYRFADALKAKGVPYALHIYKAPAFNGNDHGFKISEADKKDNLSTLIDSWLKATPTTVDERTDYPGTIAVDAARRTYAWKGAAGAKWNAAANWTPSESGSAKGYPADMVYPIAAFSGDATVDLDGKEQYAVQFSLAAGKSLTVKNGTLKCVYHPSYAGANTLRIQNATVERPFYTTEPDKGFGLKGSDSALLLENGSLIGSFYHEGNGTMRLDATGTCSLQDFNDVGAGSGATLAVRDGTLALTGKGPYGNGGLNHNGGDLTVALTNATVTAANVKHNGGTVRFAIRLGANNTTATPVFKSAGSDNLSKLSSLVFDIDATDVMTAGTYPIYAATGLTLPAAFDPAGATVRCVEGMSGTLAKNGNALDLVLTGSPSGPVIKYGAGYHPETGLTVREKTIACFGDSLTYGEGTTGNRIGNAHFNYGFENNNNNNQTYNYPLFLQESLGDEWDVVSVSQGGQTAESILAWQGGLPLTFGTAVTIPGDGSRSAAWEGMLVGTAKAAASARCFTEPNVWTDTYGAMTGTLDDGSRVRWQCHAWTHKDIARLAAAGADKTYPVGTTFIPDSATHFTDAIQVICAGANNGNAAYATVIGFIDKGLGKITGGKANGKYLIVSPHRDKGKNDSTAAMEAAYAAAFGEAHYLNLRREMATRGLQIAVAQGWMSQSAAEATTWDTPETGLLSSDNLHFNTTGYRVFAYLVKEKLQALGYLGETPEPTHAHDWSAWTLVQEATCQQAGSSNRTCRASGCDIGTETVTIPKVGHVYVDGACKWCHAADPSGSHVGAWTSFGLAAADFVPMPADENAALGRCTSRTYVTDGKLEKVDSSKQYGNNSVDISLAEATDITELRVYSAWDSGRDGFGIDWVAVQTAGSSSFVNLNVAEFPYTNPGKFGMCAALKAPDGKKLASGVTAVRVHFSACENSWIGLGEIEVRRAGGEPEPEPKTATLPAAVSGLAYDGQPKTGVPAGEGYAVAGNAATDAGDYTATLTLADGYGKWSDGGTQKTRTIPWTIAKGVNAWTANPSVSPATWTEGKAPATIAISTGANAFGAAVSCDATAESLKALKAGTRVVTFTAAGCGNYDALVHAVTVTVSAAETDPLSAEAWTAHMQGVDTAEKLAAVKARVAGKKTVKIAFANSSTDRTHGTPHDDFEQNEMYKQAAYFGLSIEIVRIQPVDLANGRTLGVVYQEAVEKADIVCDFSSYWDDSRNLAANVIAANPDKLFVLPYGEIGNCPPTGTSLQGMAQHRDGTGLKNVILTSPIGPTTGGSLTFVARRTAEDTETITFVIPSGWAGGTGDTCRSASMAGVLTAWIWAARGDSPTAAEIVALLADASALPTVSAAARFTAEHLEALKANLAAYAATDAFGRSKLIFDKPVNMYNLLPLLPEPEEPASTGKWYRLTVDSVRDPSKNQIQFSEFYLYDAQGNRLNSRLAVANVTDASQLAGGQCFLTGVNVWDLTSQNVDKLFDGDMNTKLGGGISDSSNVRIVLRLPEGSAEVAAYNFATASDDNNATWGRPRQLTAWTLEVSEDGRTWTELDKVPLFDPPAIGKVKYSAQDFTVGGESREPDTQPVTYTWTGEGGDGCWTNRANWSSSVTPCFGYPDSETYAKAVFNGDATVDLGGEAIETCGTDGQGVTVAANARVTIRNGRLKWNNRNDRGMAVGENASVTLENVALECERYGWEKRHTLVCRGETSLSGLYRPWNVSGALEIRDGATSIGKLEGYGGTFSDNRILVSNATLTVAATANLANGRPYRLQRGGKLVVKGTSGTTAIGLTTGFSFEGGAFEAPDGLAVDFSGAMSFAVKAAAYGASAGEHVLIETKGTLTLAGNFADGLDVAGLPDGLAAELVKSENALTLVLASAKPSVTVDGVDVPLGELFSPTNACRANSGSRIVFPVEPTVVTGATRTVSIECGGERVEVPAYYDVTVRGRDVVLALNEKARPVVAVPKAGTTPALVVTGDAFSLSADNVIPGFWYWLEMTPQLPPSSWTPCAESLSRAANSDVVPLSAGRAGDAGFYRVRANDVKPQIP